MKIRSFLDILRDPDPAAAGGGAPATQATPPPSGGDPAASSQSTPPATPPASGGEPPANSGTPPATPPPPAGFWKDDWREQYAGADEKRLNELKRYASAKEALDGLFAAKKRIQEGSLAPQLKANATPEEIKAYREQMGVPESPDKYEIKPPSNRTIAEENKPALNKIAERLHGVHAKPEVVNAAVEAFLDIEEQALSDLSESDSAARREVEETMRMEWGGDYQKNVALINNMLDGAPEGVKDALTSARDANGITMLNNPSVLRWLAAVTRELNPTATIIPTGANPGQTIADELNSLKKMMGDYNSDYWKGPNANKLQARFRELTSAQETVQKRAA